jgi:hypothetical protein
VPCTQIAKPQRFNARRTLIEFAFDFDLFFANAMSFEPMKFNPTNVTTRGTNQGNSLHLPPFAFSELLVQSLALLYRRPTREGFDSLDVTQEFRSIGQNGRLHGGKMRNSLTILRLNDFNGIERTTLQKSRKSRK